MERQLLIRPGKIADQSRGLRRHLSGVQIARVGLFKGRLQRSVAETLAQRDRQIADAARPQVELQSSIRIDLAVLGAFASRVPTSPSDPCCETLARDQLIRARRLHRINGLGRAGGGLLNVADPVLGSSVKNDFPKLNATSGTYQESFGKNVIVAFGEFSPTSVFHEFAGVTRSWLSMLISSRRQPR